MPHLLNKPWVRATLAATVVTGLAIGISGSTYASESEGGDAAKARPHSKKKCVTSLEGWTEETMQHFRIGPANPYPVQNVGEALIYDDLIFDENDKEVGHAVGYVNAVRRAADGDLITTYNHTVELPEGNLTGVGLVNRTEMFAGAEATFHVKGTSGAYAGKTGTLKWTLLQSPPDFDTRVSLDLKLCG
ncbi:hypothetical protein ACFUN8_23855 [Streptomyces sp. NPDC057307]|uniref:allene oxide cyclase barrel-like domain-containing protein n=1 Tax=Streptomyces sp. NPDC057307 TaxID=3346096 RepID=UPI00363E91C1